MDVPLGATGEDVEEDIGAETWGDNMLGIIIMQADKQIWDKILAVLGRRSDVTIVGKEDIMHRIARIDKMCHEGVHKLCEVEPGGDSLGGLS